MEYNAIFPKDFLNFYKIFPQALLAREFFDFTGTYISSTPRAPRSIRRTHTRVANNNKSLKLFYVPIKSDLSSSIDAERPTPLLG